MIELLAPVRDEVSFTAAVEAGADAVYLGLGELNMRVRSRGIEPEKLGKIVQKAHRRKVKVYVTLNTIIYDEDLPRLEQLLAVVREAKADAVIGWDLAVVQQAKSLGIPIHISTLANISNTQAARFYETLGAKRLVLARELSLEQIRQIKKNTPLEIEVFGHGALCVSISGRCFLSEHLFGRSANRGDCLQPCRREYTILDKETGDELALGNHYILSPKDLCTLPILDQLIEAGIDSLKIEGRSRAPEYIQTVVRVYRQAIDAVADGRFNQEQVAGWVAELSKVYNRGFSTGFLMGRPGPQDWNDRYGSRATRRKIHIGKILNYYKKTRIAYLQVESNPLAVGDIIQIHGPTTGIVECTIQKMRDEDRQEVSAVEKGPVTFHCQRQVRKNDLVYKVAETEEGG